MFGDCQFGVPEHQKILRTRSGTGQPHDSPDGEKQAVGLQEGRHGAGNGGHERYDED
ncbi:hypothetical protein [Halorientalis sp.]|uniref:hypothetical protein n=1 Tax=Halorientalis sp. TaxID=1931229 RepID=UPI002629C1A7|nr:hypothetical protein [Halorientalis sp.]